MRVLLAQTDPRAGGGLEQALRDLGRETAVVGDGGEALKVLEDPRGPRVAVLDGQLATMGGLEVCRRLRQSQRDGYVYAILVTTEPGKAAAAEALRAGADACLSAPIDPGELEAQLHVAGRILALQAEVAGARQGLREQASRDALTGLWSRGAILQILRAELARAGREGLCVAVILADVDRFRKINDSLGLRAADLVLQEVCTRMRTGARPYDMIGRYSSGEFLSVLPRCDAAAATQVAERTRKRLAAQPIMVGGAPVPVTLSFGVAAKACPDDADGDSLIRAATLALCRAKSSGRNRVEIAPALD